MKYNTLLFPRKRTKRTFPFSVVHASAIRLFTDDPWLCQTDRVCRHVCFFPRSRSESGAVIP